MGAGGSVVVAATARTAALGGQAALGTVTAAAGAVGSVATLGQSDTAGQLFVSGVGDVMTSVALLSRDGAESIATMGGVVVASCAGAVARIVEEPTAAPVALRGALFQAPMEAASQLLQGNGGSGAILAAFAAAHGQGGSVQESNQTQLTLSNTIQECTLEEIAKMGISESFGAELPLWMLAELACGAYEDPPTETANFRCDLASIRDPTEKVEAKMVVYIRRNGGKNARGRDLAVLVFRGTEDWDDFSRDMSSIVAYEYPSLIVTTAAEIVKMYQDQGCIVMVCGHSMGGYLAEVVATTLGLNGACFCAPGPGRHNGPRAPVAGFVVINHDSDNIGNHNRQLHQSAPVYVQDGGVLQNPFRAHSITRMVGYMQTREDWTNLNLASKCANERATSYLHVFDGLRTWRPDTGANVSP